MKGEPGGATSSPPPNVALAFTEFEAALSGSAANAGLSVTMKAASGATIDFGPQNGEAVVGTPPETRGIPYLTLYRNGTLTPVNERTLVVEVRGIEVPPAGITVTLRVETQHGDPDDTTGTPPRIPAWSETQRITNTRGVTETGVSMILTHEFGGTVLAGRDYVTTPTDYFRYDLVVRDAGSRSGEPLHALQADDALLMENQWIAPLPEVPEQAARAAPDELIVYYGDMFPFRRDLADATTWLPREDVPAYVRSELVPAMVDAFRLQSEGWGFPWYEEWVGYRAGVDGGRLSVALSDGQTWFHGKAPRQGDAAISINVRGKKAEYETLKDGLMRIFHHELFHHHQRNIDLHHGGSGDIAGEQDAWALFVEGMAVLATSVAQSSVEFDRMRWLRSYMVNARGFIGHAEFLGEGLNESYASASPYHSAIYWRFLYEQCGGMAGQTEDPAAGMAVIRQVLEALYSKDIVDVHASTDLVAHLPAILDHALERSSCPFDTHEASLRAFARAIYTLRLEAGRCSAPGTPAGCLLYDPKRLYPDPPVDTILYSGSLITHASAQQRFRPGMPGSFGIDLVEIVLDPGLDGQSLTLDFFGAPEAGAPGAEFRLEVWRLMAAPDGSRRRPVADQGASPEILTPSGPDGHTVYAIPAIDTAQYNTLGLAITRVDAREDLDPKGSYTILIHPGSPGAVP